MSNRIPPSLNGISGSAYGFVCVAFVGKGGAPCAECRQMLGLDDKKESADHPMADRFEKID